MKKLLLISFFAVSFFVDAQTSFVKTFGQYTYGHGVAQMQDGSIMILADSLENGGGRNFILIKTDSGGSVLWSKVYNTNNSYNYAIQRIFTSYDGNLIIVKNGSFTHFPSGNFTSIIKVDTSGTILWHKEYRNPVFSFNETNDHGFIMATSFDTLIGTVNYDKMILKTDSAGNVMWNKLFPKDSIRVFDSAIIQTDDGGYIYKISEDTIRIIAKLDSTGNVIRAYTLKDSWNGDYTCRNILRINSNAYLLMSTYTVACFDSSANILWAKQSYSQIYDATKLNDSVVALTGTVLGVDWNIYLQKIDVSGNTQQTVMYEGLYSAWGNSICPSLDGGVLIAGRVYWQDFFRNDLILLKTDANGFYACQYLSPWGTNPPFVETINTFPLTSINRNPYLVLDTVVSVPYIIPIQDTLCYEFTSLNEIPNRDSEIQIFPNPTTNSFTVKNISQEEKTLQIINLIGEVVYTEIIFGKNEYVVTTNLSQGIYFVRVSNVVRKLVVE